MGDIGLLVGWLVVWNMKEKGKPSMEKKLHTLVYFAYYALIVLMIYAAVHYALPVVMPFMLAAVVVLALHGPSGRFAKKMHASEQPVRIVVLLLFYVLMAVFLSLFGARILSAAGSFVMRLPEIYHSTILPVIEQVYQWMEQTAAQIDPQYVETVQNAFTQLSAGMNEQISSFSVTVINGVSEALTNMPAMVVNTIIMVVSSFYMAADLEKISAFLHEHLPQRWNALLRQVRRKLGVSLKIYLRSHTLLFLMTWAELAVGFFLLRVPHLLVISLLVALCDILPVLGTGTVLLPWAIIAALLGYYPMAAGVGVLYIVITIIRNIVEPRLVGRQIGLHPLLTLAGMLVGAHLFGILGMFGVPVALSIFVQLYDDRKAEDVTQKEKGGVLIEDDGMEGAGSN